MSRLTILPGPPRAAWAVAALLALLGPGCAAPDTRPAGAPGAERAGRGADRASARGDLPAAPGGPRAASRDAARAAPPGAAVAGSGAPGGRPARPSAGADVAGRAALVDAHRVRDLARTDGAVFVATDGGLIRVDGARITARWTVFDGLRSNAVRALWADRTGVLWIAFAQGGCQRLAAGALEPCPPALDEHRITAWAEHGGALHAVTWAGRIVRLPGDGASRPAGTGAAAGEHRRPLRPLRTPRDGGRTPPRGAAGSIEGASASSRLCASAPAPRGEPRCPAGPDGRVGHPSDREAPALRVREAGVRTAAHLVACGGRLWVGRRHGGLVALRRAGRPPGPSVAPTPIVTALACVDDTLYVGGPAGAWGRPAGGGAWRPLGGRAARRHVTLLAPAWGGLLVGRADASLEWRGPGGRRVYDLPAPVRRAVVVGDTAWLGGDRGLVVLGRDGTLREIPLPGPGDTDVAAIAARGDALALGFFRRGVAVRRGGAWRRLTRARGLPSDEVNALTYDTHGDLWIGTSAGLAVVSGGGPPVGVALPCGHVNGLSTGRLDPWGNVVLVATSCGVGVIDPRRRAVRRWEDRRDGLPHRIVYAVALWRGRLVAGTNDGLAVRDRPGAARPWRALRAGASPLDDNWITAVATTPDGDLLVGTYSGGLYRGPSAATLRRLDGPRYVNLNAIHVDGAQALVGGLDEGAWLVEGDRARRLPAACVAGTDVTGFARAARALVAATRAGAAPLAAECLAAAGPTAAASLRPR